MRILPAAGVVLAAFLVLIPGLALAGEKPLTFGMPSTRNFGAAFRNPKPPVPTNWVALHTANEPSPRAAAASAYDPVSRKVVIFGGFTDVDYPAETWVFDGDTWTNLTGSVTPPGRAAGRLIFDEPSQKLVLFGGFDGTGYKNDTWLFDGATGTWTEASPATVPVAVTSPGGFTDPATGSAMIIGGFDGSRYHFEMYAWNGSDWNLLEPPNAPPARSAAACASDRVHGITVIYGGLGSINPNSTWIWNGSDWANAFPNDSPAPRYDAAAAYDPVLETVVLFGGGAGGPELNDLWQWKGNDWLPINTGRTPKGRESFTFVFDEAIGKVVMFGGLSGAKLFNDTWVLNHRL